MLSMILKILFFTVNKWIKIVRLDKMSKNARQFLLTGPPGCGKTTLVKKICESLKDQNIPTCGFYTEELRIRGKRQGFDIITLDGQQGVLARTMDPGVRHSGPVVGQYAVHKESFEQTVLPLLSKKEVGVTVIDEIGKMELFSKGFGDKVMNIFRGNGVVLATVPIRPLPFVTKLKSDNPMVITIEVNQNNRNTLVTEVTDMITKAYSM